MSEMRDLVELLRWRAEIMEKGKVDGSILVGFAASEIERLHGDVAVLTEQRDLLISRVSDIVYHAAGRCHCRTADACHAAIREASK